MKQPHRGISFGTIFMLCVTVMVVGTTAAILPRLLGNAALNVDVTGAFSALSLDGSMPVLRMSEIPIAQASEEPEIAPDENGSAEEAGPTASPVPTATPVPGGTVSLTLGGSINIDEAVRKSAYYSEAKKYDFTEILSLLRDEMDSDLTFVTLENLACPDEAVSSVNAPPVVMDMLSEAGVDIVALGFSKAYDKGQSGVEATIDEARKRGLTTLGLYSNQVDADTLRLFSVDGVDIAFLHYTEAVSTAGKKNMNNSGADYAMPQMLENGVPNGMFADIKSAREAGADVVIVSLNWGKVSASKPTKEQQTLAQQLAEAGADVIIGAGSRVVQPITWLTTKETDGSIRHTLCAWSLGSLLNESRKDGNVVGMLLQLQISFDGDSISFEKVCYTPTYIWRYKQDGQYQYRVAVSDQPAPDGMSDDQAGYMEKAYRNIQKYLDGSPVTLRSK